MNVTQKVAADEFVANVDRAIEAVKDDPQSLGKANKLLHVVGCDGDFRHICPQEEHQALVVQALLLGVRTYLSTPLCADLRLHHALAALYELGAWRPLLACSDTGHAAAQRLLVLGSYLGYRESRGLDILNAWLKPATPFVYKMRPEDIKKMQQEIVIKMFGDAWWLFNGDDLGRNFDINQITEQKPAFRVGLLNVASEDPPVLPEMTHSS
jgi:hypothetical protein